MFKTFFVSLFLFLQNPAKVRRDSFGRQSTPPREAPVPQLCHENLKCVKVSEASTPPQSEAKRSSLFVSMWRGSEVHGSCRHQPRGARKGPERAVSCGTAQEARRSAPPPLIKARTMLVWAFSTSRPPTLWWMMGRMMTSQRFRMMRCNFDLNVFNVFLHRQRSSKRKRCGLWCRLSMLNRPKS